MLPLGKPSYQPNQEEPQEESSRAAEQAELPQMAFPTLPPPPPIEALRRALVRQMKRLDEAVEQSEETLRRIYRRRFVAGDY